MCHRSQIEHMGRTWSVGELVSSPSLIFLSLLRAIITDRQIKDLLLRVDLIVIMLWIIYHPSVINWECSSRCWDRDSLC